VTNEDVRKLMGLAAKRNAQIEKHNDEHDDFVAEITEEHVRTYLFAKEVVASPSLVNPDLLDRCRMVVENFLARLNGETDDVSFVMWMMPQNISTVEEQAAAHA